MTRRTRNWRRLLCGALFALLPLVHSGCRSPEADAEDGPKQSPAPVAVAVHAVPARSSQIAAQYELVGSVTSIRRSTLGSPVEGRVIAINVDIGDRVGRKSPDGSDSKIVQLDTESIELEIESAEATLDRLEHELAELNAGSRPEEIAAAKAKWESAVATKKYVAGRLSRAEELRESGAVSIEEFDAAKNAADAAEQTLLAARAQYDLLLAGPRVERIAQAAADVDRQRHEIQRLKVQRDDHGVEAPFDGFIAKKLTEIGQWVGRGDPLVEIVALDPVDVIVHVPESLVHQLTVGDAVPLHFAALGEDSEVLEGTIHGISPSADRKARTFPVRVRIDNPVVDDHYLLRDAMHARATLSGKKRSGLMVPKDAIVLGGRDPVVKIADSDGAHGHVAKEVPVQLGAGEGSWIEVTGELTDADLVIVSGNERLRSGDAVRIVEGSSYTKE